MKEIDPNTATKIYVGPIPFPGSSVDLLKTNPVLSEKEIIACVSAIKEAIDGGELKKEEVEKLIEHGVSKEVVEYYKLYYGKISE
jgi:hypothetical protein